MKKNNRLWFVLAGCFLLRGIVFLIFKPWDHSVVSSVILQGDAKYYDAIANNLLDHRSFSHTSPSFPDAIRTPLYPMFISFFYSIFGRLPWLVILAQLLVEVVSCLFVFKTAELAFNRKTAIISSTFYAIDPFLIGYSLTLLSEDIFLVCIVISCFFLVRYLKEGQRINHLVLSSFFLGITILVRPVALYLIVILPVFLLLQPGQSKNRVWSPLIYLLTALIVISPWLIRNKTTFGSFFLSTSGNYNMLVLFVAPMQTEKGAANSETAKNKLLQEADSLAVAGGKRPDSLNDFEKSFYWRKLALSYIREHPVLFVKSYGIGMVHSFTNLDTKHISETLHLVQLGTKFEIKEYPGFSSAARGFLKSKTRAEITIAIFLSLFLIVSYAFALKGLAAGLGQSDRRMWLLFAGYFLYFILLAGPAGLVRFRLPSIPFMDVFIGVGLYSFRGWWKKARIYAVCVMKAPFERWQ